MSALTITLPSRYPFVALAAVSTIWLTNWQAFVVGRNRKAAGVAYPQAYAEKAEAAASPAALKFNCAQRAHQNTLESLPQILTSILLVGLKYPTLAASLGASWTVGRILYTLGYLQDASKRGARGGFIASFAMLGLWGSSTWVAVEWVLAAL